MSKLLAQAALAALSLSSILSAQNGPIRMIGNLMQIPGGYTIREIEGETVYLATSQDLTLMVGNTVDVRGRLRDDPTSPTVWFDVDSIQNSPNWFGSDASAPIGGEIDLRIEVATTTRYFLFASLNGSHTPLEEYAPVATGTLWIDPNGMLTLGSAVIDRRFRGVMDVPNDPSLIGMSYYLQPALHTEPGPVVFINARKVTILP